jgi:hypothetical protein
MSPDTSQLFYADQTNPQSLNLYAYVRNNPLMNTDPSGMECVWDDGSYDAADDKDTGSSEKCSGQGGTWVDPNLFENSLLTNGQNANIQYGQWSGQANSTIASSWLTPSSTTNATPDNSITLSVPMDVWNFAALQTTPTHGLWTYGNWAGSGGKGVPIDDVDAAAMMHDYCYHQGGFTAGSNYGGHSDALQACNQALCDAASNAGDKAIGVVNAAAMKNQVPRDGGHAMDEANAAADIVKYFSIVPFGNSCKGH